MKENFASEMHYFFIVMCICQDMDDIAQFWWFAGKNYIPLGPNNAVYGDLFVTGLRNGLLSDGTKPSFESRLIPCHESRKRKPWMNIYQ